MSPTCMLGCDQRSAEQNRSDHTGDTGHQLTLNSAGVSIPCVRLLLGVLLLCGSGDLDCNAMQAMLVPARSSRFAYLMSGYGPMCPNEVDNKDMKMDWCFPFLGC